MSRSTGAKPGRRKGGDRKRRPPPRHERFPQSRRCHRGVKKWRRGNARVPAGRRRTMLSPDNRSSRNLQECRVMGPEPQRPQHPSPRGRQLGRVQGAPSVDVRGLERPPAGRELVEGGGTESAADIVRQRAHTQLAQQFSENLAHRTGPGAKAAEIAKVTPRAMWRSVGAPRRGGSSPQTASAVPVVQAGRTTKARPIKDARQKGQGRRPPGQAAGAKKAKKCRLVGPVTGEAHRRPREGAEPDLLKSLRRCGREVGIKTRANDATVI